MGGSTTGSGFGAAGVGELLDVPKKEFKASVMALGAISISGFFDGAGELGGTGADLALGFSAAGCKKAKGFDASAFFSTLTGSGGVGLTGATGFSGANTNATIRQSV